MPAQKRKFLWLLVALAIAAYAAVRFWPQGELTFQARADPPGFRDLVLAGMTTQLDPTIGPPPAPRTRMTGQALCDSLFRDPAAPESGNGIVQVAAFLDYRCPYCKTLSKILDAMQAEKDIRLVHKEWPILSQESELAARAALAASRQGRYGPFHARLMETRLIPTESLIESFAAELKLDVARLRADMAAEDISAALARNGALAGQFGFIGTPALVVGRTVVQGEVTRGQLERLIDEETAASTLPPC